jgi:acetoacetyl-CoA synthetase
VADYEGTLAESRRPRAPGAARRHLQRVTFSYLSTDRDLGVVTEIFDGAPAATSSPTPSTRRPPDERLGERPFSVGQVVWTPTEDAREHSLLARYMASLGRSGQDYRRPLAWSVSDLEGFWASIWASSRSGGHAVRAGARLADDARRRVVPGARLNFAAHMLGRDDELDAVAVLARSQSRDPFDLTFGDCATEVARAPRRAPAARRRPGDRVVAYLPNIPETLVAFLAAASLGASGRPAARVRARSVLDRLGQLEPKVLLAVDGYRWARAGSTGASRSRRSRRAAVPAQRRPRAVRRQRRSRTRSRWDELVAEQGRSSSTRCPFDHPLYVLFSSGTTGLPKAIVHGTAASCSSTEEPRPLVGSAPGDRLMWFTTTAVDDVERPRLGAPAARVDRDARREPRLSRPRPAVAADRGDALDDVRAQPGVHDGLPQGGPRARPRLRPLDAEDGLRRGSPLPADSYEWIYDQAGPEMMLNVGSGGTDVCTGHRPGLPAPAGLRRRDGGQVPRRRRRRLRLRRPGGRRRARRARHPAADAVDAGRFWNDDDGSRYRAAYFDFYPGVWRHGDWIMFTERGTSIITGRSDATLNRGGVRLGTSELYGVVEEFDEVLDALVVHLEATDELLLFVVLREGPSSTTS